MPNHALTSEPVARVLSRVQAKPSGTGWIARCPAHDDHTPSLSIAQGDDGRVLLNCFAGCSHQAIAAALGIEVRELFPAKGSDRTAPSRPSRPVREFKTSQEAVEAYRTKHGPEAAMWTYHDPRGEPIGLVLRWNRKDGKKDYRPVWRFGDRWRQSMPDTRPIYGLDRLTAAPGARVFVAEGEKCADLLAGLGLLSTTSPGGSNSAGKGDWSPLAGREVVIVPDEGESGRKYEADVLQQLAALDPPAKACPIALPGLADREDVEQFIDRVHGGDGQAARKAIEELAGRAAAATPRKRVTLGELLTDARMLAKPRTIASGWGVFDRVQPFEALEMGTVSVLSAPPGCYKTATMLRLARGFAEQGHQVAWLAGEMQARTLVRRMVCQCAQLTQSALLADPMPIWHRDRIERATARLAPIAERIEFVGAPIGLDDIRRAADGAAVVFVDYLQLIRHPDPGVRGHERLEEAMGVIAEAAQRSGAAFILASAQGREGGEKRGLQNATRGSSSIEFTADALYCAEAPRDKSRDGIKPFSVEFKCLKQREGAQMEIVVPIDGRTGVIAEDAP